MMVLGVIVADGEIIAVFELITGSDVVDWWIFVLTLTSEIVGGIVFAFSCVFQIIERWTSHDKSTVELHKRKFA